MSTFNFNENTYKALLDNTHEALFIVNSDGTICYANVTAITATGYKNCIGVRIDDIFPMAIHIVNGKVTWKEDETAQTFAYRENKTCFPVKLYCYRADDDEEAPVYIYADDDSERYDAVRSHRKAMEEVEEATKMKNEFTANITHELRTPINGIKGMAEGLAETELSPEQSETVGIILHCCENMTKIINDILDFSKIEAGKIELENREFSLNKFLNDTLTFHIGKIHEKGLKLIVNVNGNIPDRLIGDELRLGQVLNNLFSNAIKFTSEGHIGFELTANTDKESDEVELFFMIIDTGIGISPEERDKLFKSFSQVDGSITRRFGGTGLGLAITKQMVTLMGGNIRVDSEKGKGSTFSFTVKLKNSIPNGPTLSFPSGKFEFTSNIPMASRKDAGDIIMGISGKGQNSSEEASYGYSDSEFVFSAPSEDEEGRKLRENIERLTISIELGSWEKAEHFASTIKGLVGSSDKEIKNKAFSLVLSVRKELYEQSLTYLEELENLIEAQKNDNNRKR